MLGASEVRNFSPRERARRLAVVPQFETNVFSTTVREMVATGRFCWQEGYFAGHPDAETDHALARAGASHLASRSIWDLSGGERQRVLIARALAQKADWMLLDEATTFLDLRAEFELIRLLEELHAEGLSILSVTHDLQAASRADCITILTPGAIQQGTPEEILTPSRLEQAYGIPFFVERREGLMLIGPAVPPASSK
jgi:iron complex transport system ATP-binding protein